MIVDACDVREGDYLPGVDNGYVFEVTDAADKVVLCEGRYSIAVGDEMTLISFNTANGDEAYIVLPDNMPVTVERA